ncbi:unnamed protein product, partial [marine sediment metagenome]
MSRTSSTNGADIIAPPNIGRKGWLNRVAVDPEFQGKGLAKKLCLETENVLRKKGCMIFAMQIHDSNKRSKEMAKGLGYEE